ncbi:MAG: class E sortase [Acidimicrobiia bacterium]|nr:class E sortase [Acidimicrobiia bacterium]
MTASRSATRGSAAGNLALRSPLVFRAEGGERALTPLDPVRLLGQLLLWVGALLLLFALYQLWGTSLLEWRAQQALESDFDALLVEAPDPDDARTGRAADAPAGDRPGGLDGPLASLLGPPRAMATPPVAPAPLPAEGEAIGRITIPAIGVTKTIVQGVERGTLRNGPGHYPSTPMPGQPGNAAIAGHRTTHGAPFFDIDRLQPGDHIDVETIDGTFRYEVQGHPDGGGVERGHLIVHPSEVAVIGDQGDDRLTLTACNPKYSARQRIVVTALLVGEPSAPPVVIPDALVAVPSVTSEPPDLSDPPADGVPNGAVDGGQTVGVDDEVLEDSLGWQSAELDPTVLWATVTLLILHVGWIVGRVWHTFAYLATFPVAAVPLFVCFVHLDRLLPAY